MRAADTSTTGTSINTENTETQLILTSAHPSIAISKGTEILDFESAKIRAAEIKADLSQRFLAKLSAPVHFGAGISANLAALLYLSDHISSNLGLDATAAALAAAGFDVAHLATDLIINHYTKKVFLSELEQAQESADSPIVLTDDQLDECINLTHVYPKRFYPYVLIMGTVLFTGLNYGATAIADYFSQNGANPATDPYFYLCNIAMNLGAGIVFPAAGTLLKAQVPAALTWVIFVANNAGLALAPVQKQLLETYGGAAFLGAATGLAAAGALVGRVTAPYVTKAASAAIDGIKSLWSKIRGSQQGYTEVQEAQRGAMQMPTATV
ncbi:MAG: hypothetical protein K0S08_1923 [Gammaproteobacteria bacterium]|jgi:hypothetical protein|nr:hypothetical protein [Gammaproteobacteria bacterium]